MIEPKYLYTTLAEGKAVAVCLLRGIIGEVRIYNVRTSNLSKVQTIVHIDGVDVTSSLTNQSATINGNAHTCYYWNCPDTNEHEVIIYRSGSTHEIYGFMSYCEYYRKIDMTRYFNESSNTTNHDPAVTWRSCTRCEEIDLGTYPIRCTCLTTTFHSVGNVADDGNGCLIKNIYSLYVPISDAGAAINGLFQASRIRFESRKFVLSKMIKRVTNAITVFGSSTTYLPDIDIIDLSGVDFSKCTSASRMLPEKHDIKVIVDKDFNMPTSLCTNFNYGSYRKDLYYEKEADTTIFDAINGTKNNVKLHECGMKIGGELVIAVNYNGTPVQNVNYNGIKML